MERGLVLIVDDHPAVREALVLRIGRQPDLAVCGEASDMSEALGLLAVTQPDVAVVDISLRNANGLELIKRIRDRNQNVRILVWSMHSESHFAERALRAGALGYITKERGTDQIIEAIRRVRNDKVYLCPEIEEKLLRRIGARGDPLDRSPADCLSDRELEVFQLIGMGVKTSDIAKRMHLSVKTVDTYRDRIRRKLSVDNGTTLAHVATQWVLEHR